MFLLWEGFESQAMPGYRLEVVSADLSHELEYIQNFSCHKEVSDLIQNENYAQIVLYKNK